MGRISNWRNRRIRLRHLEAETIYILREAVANFATR